MKIILNITKNEGKSIIVKCECPSCFYEFELDDDTIEGEVISCEDCGVDLEIIKIEGDIAKLVQAELSDEDWGE